MRKKFSNLTKIIPISKVLIIIIILLTFISCSNSKNASFQDSISSISTEEPLTQPTADSFDINVKISYKVTIDSKISGIDPNIIKATRQALFDYDCDNAKFAHYNGYTVETEIYIFDVNETSENTWEVKFWVKSQNSKSYDKNGYSFVTVEKQNTGSFKGYIINPGGPMIRGDETY